MRLAPLLWMFIAAVPALAQTAESATTAPRYAQPADIPVAAFFRRAAYSKMSISPDGNRLAALRPINGLLENSRFTTALHKSQYCPTDFETKR